MTDKERYLELLSSVKREGMDMLISYLEKSTFFTDPCSTRFHLCCEGGLVKHSLNVYTCLIAKKDSLMWKPVLDKIPDESLIIMALLHDLCKIGSYDIEMRNKKIDGEWVQVPTYTYNDKVCYGHGEGSAMIASSFIKLTKEEQFAIRWHMGAYVGQQDWNTLGYAMKRFPVILALHSSDQEANVLLESEE